MMYTPTPATRRPRPPRSLSRQRDPLISSTPASEPPEKAPSKVHSQPLTAPQQSSGHADETQHRGNAETPLSTYIRQRQKDARNINILGRISASPADVSFALDVDVDAEQVEQGRASHDLNGSQESTETTNGSSSSKATRPSIGLGLLSSMPLHNSNAVVSESSPPPPYGHMLPTAPGPSSHSPPLMSNDSLRSHSSSDSVSRISATSTHIARPNTPPRQDSGLSSRQSLTHPLTLSPRFEDQHRSVSRRRSATESSGIPEASGGKEHSRSRSLVRRRRLIDSSDDELGKRDLRAMLKGLEQQLERKDNELTLATQVAEQALRSHDRLISVLPRQMKALIPAHLVQPQYDAQSRSPSLRHLRSLSGSSPYPLHVRQLSSTSETPGMSPVESSPPSARTRQDEFSGSDPSKTHHGYPLSSPFRIISPEQAVYEPQQQRHFRTLRLSDTSLPYPHHRQKVRPPLIGSQSMGTNRPPSPRYARLSAMQAEAEDRIVGLEQALAEARESEESQRKIASRLRKEMDKLQRELLRADERRAEEEEVDLRASVTGAIGTRRTHPSAEDEDRTESLRFGLSAVASIPIRGELGWGLTTFPEFPATQSSRLLANEGVTRMLIHQEPKASLVDEPFGQVTIAALRDQVDRVDDLDTSMDIEQESTQLLVRTIHMDDAESISNVFAEDEFTKRDEPTRIASPSRKPLSDFASSSNRVQAFQQPGSDPLAASPQNPAVIAPSRSHSPPAARVTIKSPRGNKTAEHYFRRSREGSDSQGSGGRSIRRSPWPSPRTNVAMDISPDVRKTLDFLSSDVKAESRSPSMSPAFASLNSRMVSMRSYAHQSLSMGHAGVGRTLGSELGSELGGDWDKDVKSLDSIQWNAPAVTLGSPSPPSRSHSNRSSFLFGYHQGDRTRSRDQLDNDNVEDDLDDEDDTSLFSPLSQPPLPLPANVSKALSSLAMALAPATMFAPSLPQSTRHVVPKGSLREPGIDYTAYEALNEACRLTKIKWAGDEVSSDTLPQSGGDSARYSGGMSNLLAEGAETLKQRMGQGFAPVPVPDSMINWAAARDPWDASEYPDDSSVSERDSSDSRAGEKPLAKPRVPLPIRLGKRPVSYLGPVRRDTPRRFALAHRRANSAAIVRLSTSPSTSVPSAANNTGPDGQHAQPRYIANFSSTGAIENMSGPSLSRRQEVRPDQTLTRRGLRSIRPIIVSTDIIESDEPSENEYTAIEKKNGFEPSTIPARFVHDVFCLLNILLEYLEWMIILLIRICIDIKSGPNGTSGLRRRDRAKRYYL